MLLLACAFNVCLLYLKIEQTISNTLVLYFLTQSYFTEEELKGSLKCVPVTHNRIAYKITPIALYIAQRSLNGIIFQMGKKPELANAYVTNFPALSVRCKVSKRKYLPVIHNSHRFQQERYVTSCFPKRGYFILVYSNPANCLAITIQRLSGLYSWFSAGTEMGSLQWNVLPLLKLI